MNRLQKDEKFKLLSQYKSIDVYLQSNLNTIYEIEIKDTDSDEFKKHANIANKLMHKFFKDVRRYK